MISISCNKPRVSQRLLSYNSGMVCVLWLTGSLRLLPIILHVRHSVSPTHICLLHNLLVLAIYNSVISMPMCGGGGGLVELPRWPSGLMRQCPLYHCHRYRIQTLLEVGEKVVGSNFWLVSGHFLPTSQLTNYNIVLTLPVLRHFLTKDKGYTDF